MITPIQEAVTSIERKASNRQFSIKYYLVLDSFLKQSVKRGHLHYDDRSFRDAFVNKNEVKVLSEDALLYREYQSILEYDDLIEVKFKDGQFGVLEFARITGKGIKAGRSIPGYYVWNEVILKLIKTMGSLLSVFIAIASLFIAGLSYWEKDKNSVEVEALREQVQSQRLLI